MCISFTMFNFSWLIYGCSKGKQLGIMWLVTLQLFYEIVDVVARSLRAHKGAKIFLKSHSNFYTLPFSQDFTDSILEHLVLRTFRVKKAERMEGAMPVLKWKAFIANRNPNPAARILLIHRIKTITKKGTIVTTLGQVRL